MKKRGPSNKNSWGKKTNINHQLLTEYVECEGCPDVCVPDGRVGVNIDQSINQQLLTEYVECEGCPDVRVPDGGVGGPAGEAGPVVLLQHAQAHRALAHVPVTRVGLETALWKNEERRAQNCSIPSRVWKIGLETILRNWEERMAQNVPAKVGKKIIKIALWKNKQKVKNYLMKYERW